MHFGDECNVWGIRLFIWCERIEDFSIPLEGNIGLNKTRVELFPFIKAFQRGDVLLKRGFVSFFGHFPTFNHDDRMRDRISRIRFIPAGLFSNFHASNFSISSGGTSEFR